VPRRWIAWYLGIMVTEDASSARTKNMMLRLDPGLAERLEAVAEVEGRSVSDVVREAIAALVEERRKDKRFGRLLEDNLARHRRIFELLRDDAP
jgi:Arc/MetJ-type ribon-helix-helix transcriptional regulator